MHTKLCTNICCVRRFLYLLKEREIKAVFTFKVKHSIFHSSIARILWDSVPDRKTTSSEVTVPTPLAETSIV
jgi:hypothetical protein